MGSKRLERIFDKYFEQINAYADDLAAVRETKELRTAAKSEILEAYVLKIHVTWEVFAEDLLVYCLGRNTTQYGLHTGTQLPRVLPVGVCKGLVSGLGFFDIKGSSHLRRISKDILVPIFNPFKKITKDARAKIDEFYKLRNYIAHQSYRAKRTLTRMYENSYQRKTFIESSKFLSANIPHRGEETYLANYMVAFTDAGKVMGLFLGV